MKSDFEKDFEFIQFLCNPEYLKWLHKEGYFENENFIKYLKYLKYFSDEKYRIFLLYPQCLSILEILISSEGEDILKDGNFIHSLTEDQYYLWKYRK